MADAFGVISASLGLIGQIVATIEGLLNRYQAVRSFNKTLQKIQESYVALQCDLQGIGSALEAKTHLLPEINREVFERYVADLTSGLTDGLSILRRMTARATRRYPTVLTFCRSGSISKEFDTLQDILRMAESRIQCMLTAILISSSTEDILQKLSDPLVWQGENTTQLGAKDRFVPFFFNPPSVPEVEIDFDEHGPCSGQARLKAMTMSQAKSFIALRGMSGVGKSCTLRALTQDSDMKHRYPDGIHYVRLGMDATLVTLVEELRNVLLASGAKETVSKLKSETNVDIVIESLSTWLRGKQFLLLVDDAWLRNGIKRSIVDLNRITDAGNMSTLVVATTCIEIASLASKNVELTYMDPVGPEARRILLRYAGFLEEDFFGSDEAEQADFALQKLLKICGGLPISLATVGKGIKRRSLHFPNDRIAAWELYLSAIELNGHIGIDDPIVLTLSTSLKILEVYERHKILFELPYSFAEMHRALCVLQRPSCVPMQMLRNLWKLKEIQHAATVSELFAGIDLATLTCQRNGSRCLEMLELHDLLHDFCRIGTREETVTWHKRLLEEYRWRTCQPTEHEHVPIDQWALKLEDDGYIHKNLSWHASKAWSGNEMIKLLLNSQWIFQQLKIGGYFALRRDYQLCISSISYPRSNLMHRAIMLIYEAIELSSGTIMANPHELCFQLYGRLRGFSKQNTFIEQFLLGLQLRSTRPWVKPSDACLTEPGGIIRKVIPPSISVTCCIAVGNEGDIAFGCADGSIKVIDTKSGKKILCWQAHTGDVDSIATTRNGNIIVSTSRQEAVKIWKRKGCEIEQTMTQIAPLFNCVSAAIHPNGNWACGGSKFGMLQFFTLHTPAKIIDIDAHNSAIYSLNTSPDGRTVLSGAWDGTVSIWYLGSAGWIRRQNARAHEGMVQSIAVITGHAVSAASDNTIVVWDTDSGEQVGRAIKADICYMNTVSIDADGKRIIAGGQQGLICAWDLETLVIQDPMRGENGPIAKVISLPQGETLSCSTNGSIRVWYEKKRRQNYYHNFKDQNRQDNMFSRRVKCLAIVPHSENALIGYSDGCLQMWNVELKRHVGKEMHGHERQISEIAVCPNGKMAVSASGVYNFRLWDLDCFSELCVYHEYRCKAHRLAISECFIATSTSVPEGSSAFIWIFKIYQSSHDAASVEVRVRFDGHAIAFSHLCITKDQKCIISASTRGIRTWDIQSGQCLELFEPGYSQTRLLGLSTEDVVRVSKRNGSCQSKGIRIRSEGSKIVNDLGEKVIVLATMESIIDSWIYFRSRNTICVVLESGKFVCLEMCV